MTVIGPMLPPRWYQVAVFMPVMRVHSTLTAKPHFPFASLWGREASAAMRRSLELRYRLDRQGPRTSRCRSAMGKHGET